MVTMMMMVKLYYRQVIYDFYFFPIGIDWVGVDKLPNIIEEKT